MKTAATTYESYSGISIVFLFMMRPCRKSYRTAFMDGKPLWQYEPSSKKMVYVRMERQTVRLGMPLLHNNANKSDSRQQNYVYSEPIGRY